MRLRALLDTDALGLKLLGGEDELDRGVRGVMTTDLRDPSRYLSGGELVLTEQRPRMQSRVMVVPLMQGDGVVFAVNSRPVAGTRGTYRVTMRHGVSALRSGSRHTLGVIFHDAT